MHCGEMHVTLAQKLIMLERTINVRYFIIKSVFQEKIVLWLYL